MKLQPLFVQKNPHKKGSQFSLFRLIREFQNDNQAPVLLSSREGWLTDAFRSIGGTVLVNRFPGSRSLTARLWRNRRFAHLIKRQLKDNRINPGIVFGNDHSEGLVALHIARALEVPKVLILRHPYMSQKGFQKYGGYKMDALVSINQWMEKKVAEWLDKGPQRYFIENGLSDDEFYPPMNVAESFPDKILVPGSKEPRKGWEDMFEALILLDQHNEEFPPTQFDFTGERPPFYSKHEKILNNSRFNIRFIGHDDNFQELMRSYSLIVEPTRSETFGMVGLEAVAAGVPILSTYAGNISHILEKKFLLKTNNPQNIAEKLTKIQKEWSSVHFPLRQYQDLLKEKYSIKRTYQGYKKMCLDMV